MSDVKSKAQDSERAKTTKTTTSKANTATPKHSTAAPNHDLDDGNVLNKTLTKTFQTKNHVENTQKETDKDATTKKVAGQTDTHVRRTSVTSQPGQDNHKTDHPMTQSTKDHVDSTPKAGSKEKGGSQSNLNAGDAPEVHS